ncbi:hypothetical protein NL491_28025, partial [Klebsiella pneumoniae]|nr:hypothetical protein [Klebsiella pneumoniae]
MNDDDLKDISIDQRQSNSQSAVRLPGDRIRIEQHRISADNFAATAYLPENQVPASPLTVMAAVDIETDYVLG